MDSRVALITGTSSGIGLETAVALAAKGWRVVATMRDTGRAGELAAAAASAGVELDVRALDVTDGESIGSVIEAVGDDHGRLDALINNAGAGHVGTIEVDDIGAYRDSMEVNYFGVVALTKAALPLLRRSRGRLITVSSVGGVVGQPFNEAYCAAKFAVEGFLESLAPVAAAAGVRVSIVEPGAVRTSFAGNAGIDAATELISGTVYEPALRAYIERTSAQFASGTAQVPADVATVIVELVGADEPPVRVQTSASATAFAGLASADLDGSRVQDVTRGWIAAS